MSHVRSIYTSIRESNARTPIITAAVLASTGGPMRRCYYCSKQGSFAAGGLFKLLGRHEYAHHACRKQRLEEIAQRKALAASSPT